MDAGKVMDYVRVVGSIGCLVVAVGELVSGHPLTNSITMWGVLSVAFAVVPELP